MDDDSIFPSNWGFGGTLCLGTTTLISINSSKTIIKFMLYVKFVICNEISNKNLKTVGTKTKQLCSVTLTTDTFIQVIYIYILIRLNSVTCIQDTAL